MKRIVIPALMLLATTLQAAPAKVLLLPFDSAGPAEKQWVAKALQQNLLAELSRVNSIEPILGTQVGPTIEAARKSAAEDKADYVIFGSYQAIDSDLRMTGQVIDVTKKQSIAGLKSTGTQRDLFGMEDVIAQQVKRALPQPIAEAKPEMLQQPPAAQPISAAPPPPAIDANARARELEEQIDRAIDRLRYSTDNAGYYPDNSFYSGYYGPYYSYPFYAYPIYRNHHYYHNHSGISGSFNTGNVSGSFSTGRNFVSSPTGNFNNFGRMTMQTPHR